MHSYTDTLMPLHIISKHKQQLSAVFPFLKQVTSKWTGVRSVYSCEAIPTREGMKFLMAPRLLQQHIPWKLNKLQHFALEGVVKSSESFGALGAVMLQWRTGASTKEKKTHTTQLQ